MRILRNRTAACPAAFIAVAALSAVAILPSVASATITVVTPGEQNTLSTEFECTAMPCNTGTFFYYPDILKASLGSGYTVENNGDINGAVIGCDAATTTKGGANPYNTDQPYKNSINPLPDIVIIGPFGEHDQRMVDQDAALYSEATYQANYDALVTDYLNLSSHPKVYMMTPIDLTWGGTAALPNNEDLIKDIMLPAALAVAQSHGLTVIDTYTAITPGGTVEAAYNGSDGQLSSAGQQKMAELILAALESDAGAAGDAAADTGTESSGASSGVASSGSSSGSQSGSNAGSGAASGSTGGSGSPSQGSGASSGESSGSTGGSGSSSQGSGSNGGGSGSSSSGSTGGSGASEQTNNAPSTTSGCTLSASGDSPWGFGLAFVSLGLVALRRRRTDVRCGQSR